jgi:uncharacterized protein (TIGR02265 family)
MDNSDSGESLTLGSEEELQWRLSFLAPGENVRGVFINSLLDVVRRLGGEDTVRKCLTRDGQEPFLDFFNYPFSTYLKSIYSAAWALSEKHGSVEESLRLMGYHAAQSFYLSPPGRVVLLLAQGEPRRLLDNLPLATRTTSTVADGSSRLTGPKKGILSYKRDLMPRPYTRGALLGTFEAAHVKGVQVLPHPVGPLDTDYEISWD